MNKWISSEMLYIAYSMRFPAERPDIQSSYTMSDIMKQVAEFVL